MFHDETEEIVLDQVRRVQLRNGERLIDVVPRLDAAYDRLSRLETLAKSLAHNLRKASMDSLARFVEELLD